MLLENVGFPWNEVLLLDTSDSLFMAEIQLFYQGVIFCAFLEIFLHI